MPAALAVTTTLDKFRGFLCAQRRLFLKGLAARVSHRYLVSPAVARLLFC